MTEFKKRCYNCAFCCLEEWQNPCFGCDDNEHWQPQSWLTEWLNSFDTTSATKCFEAVNILKQRLEGEADDE